MKITRRSFLKVFGGLAAVVTLPNILAALPVIPVQATTTLTAQVSKIIKPRISIMFGPTVFINSKRLPAHRMACRLDYRHSKWVEYNPDCELTIDAEVYGDAAKKSLFDESWKTPVDVKICLSDGLVCSGQGAIVESYDTCSSYGRTYLMVIAMWDVVSQYPAEEKKVPKGRFPKYKKS